MKNKTAKSIFLDAIELDALTARVSYLTRECGNDDKLLKEVEQLLTAHDQQADLADAVREANQDAFSILDVPAPDRSGTRIGPFKLLQQIGEGGMGVVYMADQVEPVRRRVALKLIRAGLDNRSVLARFDAERQALAIMDHPNIAKVLDAGTTSDGQPYFVMELVAGVPLTEFCNRHRLAIEDRLKLMMDVCHAVQHAHQKGIIHRDLKPSNVLVTLYDGKPVPKIIDFGLAKALGPQIQLTDHTLFTAFGQVVGTFKYMSPEQAEVNAVDIDTRSDIYSLGVMLYELLTGTTPLEDHTIRNSTLLKVLEAIRESATPRPSTRLSSSNTKLNITASAQRLADPARISSLLRGELDWIVMKSLEKERSRRYSTAADLAKDLDNFLTGEVVSARPPSTTYRIGKALRKHKAFAVSAAMVAGSLIIGTAGMAWFAMDANRARIRADEKANELVELNQRSEQLRKEAEQARDSANQERARAELQRQRAEANESQAVDSVRKFAEAVARNEELTNRPDLQALRATLLREPLEIFTAIRNRLKSESGPRSMDRLAESAWQLGNLSWAIGNKTDALNAYRESLAAFEELHESDPSREDVMAGMADCHDSMGGLLQQTGDLDGAMKAHLSALALFRKLSDEHADNPEYERQWAHCKSNLGILLMAEGQTDEARKAFEEALSIHSRQFSQQPTSTKIATSLAEVRNNLGMAQLGTNRAADALKEFDEALNLDQAALANGMDAEPGQMKIARDHIHRGLALSRMGEVDQAISAYRQALEIQRPIVAVRPTVVKYQYEFANALDNLASLYLAKGEFAEAITEYQESIEIRKQLVKNDSNALSHNSSLASGYYNMGLLLDRQQKPEDASVYFQSALEIQRQLAAENPEIPDFQSLVGKTLNNLAKIHLFAGNFEQAKGEYLEAVEFQQRACQANPGKAVYREALFVHYRGLMKTSLALDDEDLISRTRDDLLRMLPADNESQLALDDFDWIDLFWDIVRPPATEIQNRLSKAQLDALRSAATRDPGRNGSRVLALTAFRLGDYQEAIDSIGVPDAEEVAEGSENTPHPVDLAILAMSHLKLDNLETSDEYREQFLDTLQRDEFKSDADCIGLQAELNAMIEAHALREHSKE